MISFIYMFHCLFYLLHIYKQLVFVYFACRSVKDCTFACMFVNNRVESLFLKDRATVLIVRAS